MDESKTIPAPAPRRRIGLWILLILLGLVVLGYLGLCGYVWFGDRAMPNLTMGDLDLSHQTREEVRLTLSRNTAALENKIVGFTYGSGETAEIPGSWVCLDPGQAADTALSVGREGSPLLYGVSFLRHLARPTALELPVTLSPEGETALPQLLSSLDRPLSQSSFTVEETGVTFEKGCTGYAYDHDGITRQLLDAFSAAAANRTVPLPHFDPTVTLPEPIDWEAINREIYVEPVNAALNCETFEIEPSVTGVHLDTALAQRLYNAAVEGGRVTVPFTFTLPEVTTEGLEATLFADILGEVTTRVSGVANRRENVRIAGELVNGTILLPEDIFAYNVCTGPRTLENGFLPAPSYVKGLTVDEVGGGICQVSSTVYYAALLANLKIVERQNHSFAVGYVPDGLDATVFYGTLDFRFQNDTQWPIKLVTSSYDKNGSRWLNVKIYGTKTDDTYVEMECNELSSTPHEVVYQPDETVPVGTLKEEVTPYRGRKVEVYRCVYAGDGTLLSRTLESVNNYKKRDQLFLYNPADAYLYDPNYQPPAVVPTPEPTVVPTPVPTEPLPPVETVTPLPEAVPTEQPPVETAPPEQTAEPTPAPAEPAPAA